MLTFSKIHDWQGNPNVKQILVFPHAAMREIFEKDYATLVEKEGVAYASDSNLGAIYKLRALKDAQENWKGIIRCGITGESLFEIKLAFESPEVVFAELRNHLHGLLDTAMNNSGIIDPDILP